VSAPCTKSHSDAEFAGTLDHRKYNDAVQTNKRKEESDTGKEAEENREKTLSAPGWVPLQRFLQVIGPTRNLLIGTDGLYGCTHRVQIFA